MRDGNVRKGMNNKLREIIVEIEGTRRELNDTVADLAQVQLDFRSSPQSWSIGEVLHHLHLVENSVVNLVMMSSERAREKNLGPDLTNGSVVGGLDHFQIEVPRRKVQAPASVVPQSGLAKNELLNALAGSRAKLLEAITAVAPYDLHQLRYTHPLLGKLDLYLWILFVSKHEQRHTRQVIQIKSDLDLTSE